jgi:hypothetical protein
MIPPPPQQPPPPESPPARVLDFKEWGWNIQLRRRGNASSVTIFTPGHGRYALEVDADGNVVEYISGNYTRVVEGSVMQYTGGATVEETEGPRVLQSGDYTALAAPQVHFNPEEFRKGVPAELPEKLRTS